MKTFSPAIWLCGAALVYGATALAISPTDVQLLVAAGEKITFLDVRSKVLFQQGHIPGAINVPAALVPGKQLPPLGRVVVYDDGLGRETALAAMTVLNQKPGITAEVLDGGFATWEAARASTTKAAGMKPEETQFITYAELAEVQSDNVVLVDLRKEPVQSRQAATGAMPAAPPEPLTDLRQQFTRVRGITRSPFDLPQTRQSSAGGPAPPPLLVLIDTGDGSAQAMARTLKANGVTRFAILAGGEQILVRQGQRGLGRAASTVVVNRPPGGSLVNTNR
jgi:rhodanese-related sulfurtransferase